MVQNRNDKPSIRFYSYFARDGKENCWVLDFNVARSFELMWEYQNIISKNNGKTLTENIYLEHKQN